MFFKDCSDKETGLRPFCQTSDHALFWLWSESWHDLFFLTNMRHAMNCVDFVAYNHDDKGKQKALFEDVEWKCDESCGSICFIYHLWDLIP
jgi:hypothetical protein